MPEAPPPPPPRPEGYYPQQAYYAPGWTAPPDRGSRRRRVVVGVLLATVVGVVVAVAVVGVTFWQQTRELGEVDGPTSASTRQVRPGHCVAELPADGTVADVTVVPCGEPHEAEVVGVMQLRQDSWPGQAAVDAQVARGCEMDTAQREAGFRAVIWTPTQASWDQGDRRGVCLAWLEGGGVTGSFADDDVSVP